MKTVTVRDVVLGEGRPKICVPIVGRTKEEIIACAAGLSGVCADMAEWRADWYEDIFEEDQIDGMLKALREALGSLPLLFTFRTAKEGGEKEITTAAYRELNERAAASGYVDLIDVEAFTGEETVRQMIQEAHGYGVKVIVSNHDFEKTPKQDEIVRRLGNMQETGADVLKIAVMPKTRRDVLTLLAATEEMYTDYADRPIITMSMSETGVISRLCGEVFGSAVTFGAAGQISAPGQASVDDLDKILTFFHKSLAKNQESR